MTSSRRRILVTGGAGFIGSHVAGAYLATGAQVWVLDDLSTGKRENVPEGVELVCMDVADPGVRDLFREARFDVVNHHAAQIDVRVSVTDPAGYARVNVLGLINLAECALESGTARFLYVSSGGVIYGEPANRPTPEAAPKLPLSPYGVSKLAGEHYLHYYNRVRGLSYVALRYGNVYGPRQDPHGEAGVVAIFCDRLLERRPLTIFGDGEQTRDYVFVRDVVAANLLATDFPLDESGETLDTVAFNVATGTGTSVNRLAALLEEAVGVRAGRVHAGERPGELSHSALDVSRLRREGWAPSHTLEEGLRSTYRHIEDTREA